METTRRGFFAKLAALVAVAVAGKAVAAALEPPSVGFEAIDWAYEPDRTIQQAFLNGRLVSMRIIGNPTGARNMHREMYERSFLRIRHL